MTAREIGITLLLAAYALLFYISLSAPFYAGTHSHLNPAMLAQLRFALACGAGMCGSAHGHDVNACTTAQ
jgi:hypothetical protein